MNRVCLIGRLTDDVKLNKTQSGKDVANFTIAINRIGEGADFISITAWNKTAEFLSNYAKKGSKVGIDGRINTRTYDDRDGKKVYVTEIVAEFAELLDPKKEGSGEGNYSKKDNSNPGGYFPDPAGSPDLLNDDLPF